jgi:Leucine-rich repeat (LRR) protein
MQVPFLTANETQITLIICWTLRPLISCAGLDSLDSLILGHNQLKEVPARVFSHLIRLNSLELDGNHITYIDPEAFLGLEGLYNQISQSRVGSYVVTPSLAKKGR